MRNNKHDSVLCDIYIYVFAIHYFASGITSGEGKGYSSILKKSPEPEDVLDLIESKSAEWDKFGRKLRVSHDTRTSLRRDPSLTNDGKLEEILRTWKQEQTSEVTWGNILTTLESMDFIDMAANVKRYLTRPDVIDKYIKTPDYEPYDRTKYEDIRGER